MKNKTLIVVIVIIIIVVIGYIVFRQRNLPPGGETPIPPDGTGTPPTDTGEELDAIDVGDLESEFKGIDDELNNL